MFKTISTFLVVVLATSCATPPSAHVTRNRAPDHQRERGIQKRTAPEVLLSQTAPTAQTHDDGPGPSNPDGALRFRRSQMEDENGVIPADGLTKAKKHVDEMKAAQRERLRARQEEGIEPQAAGIEPDSWVPLGPGNIGGRIRSIVIHPTDTNRMWIGSVSGGIWATTNGENARANWFPVNDFQANLAVTTMIISPLNPDTMYAGTGEGFGNVDAIRGAGVFQSRDGGETWNQIASTNPAAAPAVGCGVGNAPCSPFWFFVNRLAISPNGTILAATSPSFDAVGNLLNAGGLARSSDGGATWTQETNARAFDVDFEPGSNTQAVAGGEGNLIQRTVSGAGVVTWTNAVFTPAIAAQPPPRQRTSRRIEIAYAPNAPATVYALVNQHRGAGVYQGDVYRSTDNGRNFAQVHTATNFFNGGGGNQGWYDNVIWVNPQDSTFVIVGGIHLWRSTDSAATFTRISDGSLDGNGLPRSPHADHHVIVAHPGFNNTTNRRVFFGNDGGVYRTDVVDTANAIQGWSELNNTLGITQFYGAAGNAVSGEVVGGTQDNGTIRFTGGPEDWRSTDRNDGGYCASDPTDPQFFYGETQNLGVHRSIGGAMAVSITTGLADAGVAGATNFIAPLIIDPSEPNTLLAGGISLWRTTNAKATPPAPAPSWTQIKNALPADLAGNNIPISAIVVSPVASNLIFVGHNNGDIFRTFSGTLADPTATWARVDTAALPNRLVTRLVVDHTRSPANWIYATFGGFSADNVWRSTDNGQTWNDITGAGATGLPDVPVRTLVYHPTDPNLLYVGTEIGIFTSEDAGATWEPTQDGPANVSVDELFWMGGDLIAATHGRGIYRASGGIYVDCAYGGIERGTRAQPFNTVTEGINALNNRHGAVWLVPGTCTEAYATPIDERVELRSLGGPVLLQR